MWELRLLPLEATVGKADLAGVGGGGGPRDTASSRLRPSFGEPKVAGNLCFLDLPAL